MPNHTPEPLRSHPNFAFIALGSNLGDRHHYIEAALDALSQLPHTTLKAVSKLRETAPVGGPEQGPFLNAVAQIETQISPHPLLAHLQDIETTHDRVRKEHWGPRTLDLDLIAYADEIITTDTLTVPHPRMHERRFVLEPMADLAPHWRHPQLRQTITELLDQRPSP